MDFFSLKEKIENADCVLIGIGEEFREKECSKDKLDKAYKNLSDCLEGKNYFVLNICDDKVIYDAGFDENRIAAPFCDICEDSDFSQNNPFDREKNPMWGKYTKWLSYTIKNKLLIIELGCLMGSMEVVRWPFEKTVMLNNKSELVRINEKFPFVPAEISEKSFSVMCNSVDFLI